MIRYRTQLLLLAAGILLACYVGIRGNPVTRQEVSFESAPTVRVDAVWQDGRVTWTQAAGLIQGHYSHTITAINPVEDPDRRTPAAQLSARLWQLRWAVFVHLNAHRLLARSWQPHHMDYLLAGTGAAFGALLLLLVRGLGRRREAATTVTAAAKPGPPSAADAVETDGVRTRPGVDASADTATPQDQVVAFFLQLFMAQCAPGRKTKSSFTASGAKGPHGTDIYELQVQVQGKRHRRRMSIGPLGQGRVGSSLCFFVIYDLHLVVKLPRTPISDYAQYIESIDRERQIAALLSGVPVIVPRVTTVLENVHRFADHETLSTDAVEQRYIGWMRRNPAFQRYLKVGDSFAFFMELSSHHFLHHVFDDMHLSRARLITEVREYGHLVWKPHEFIGRYGAGAQPVCAQLQGVYQNCRRSLDLPSTPGDETPQITDYQHKQDFLAGVRHHLNGAAEPSVSPKGATTMRGLVAEQSAVLEHYRRILGRYLRKTLFLHHRKQIGALVANSLHLTAWLYARRIALRDIKPENLLVVGQRDSFPAFLKHRRRFRLGLIDLETATAHRGDGPAAGLLSAPKPGGTPLYATPSHFLDYEALSRIYRDPFDVLMEQDWYAAIAICFRTVTGKHLWDGSAALFPALVEMIANATADPHTGVDAFDNLFSKLSWVFWSNCRMEFRDKLRAHRPTLAKVKVILSEQCVATIQERIDKRLDNLKGELAALMDNDARLEEVVRHLQLTDATSEQIRLLRTTWEMDATADSKRAYLFSDRFRELEGLTQNLEVLEQGRALLENAEEGTEMLPLLNLLFAHCLSVMYKGTWKGLGHRRIDWHEALMDEPSYTQTL